MKNGMLIGLAVPLVFVLMVGALTPQGQGVEVLYLSDSSTNDVGTYLYGVNLNSTGLRADLTLLPSGLIPFNQVDALACTPDGAKLYAIDKFGSSAHPGTGKLGSYDVGTGSWAEIGEVKHEGAIVPGIVLAAFSPGGMLYAASENTDSLYTVDMGTAEATLVGLVVNQATGATVNVQGADIAFAADGTLYLWTNGKNGAPQGLYMLTLPASVPGIVSAVHLGLDADGSYFTGLAIRASGFGDLVGSTREDQIIVVDKTNASLVETYQMFRDGSPYDYEYGDMTTGGLVLCTKTIGYWKNHSWKGATVTICGETVDETTGKEILGDAHARNFSMFFAQLIGAKLNTYNNAIGVPDIDDAEAWLCEQSVDWTADFTSKEQKRGASGYWEALDEFNNRYPCEEMPGS